MNKKEWPTFKHGDRRDKNPLYFVWQNMRRRCNDKNNDFYYAYGGRGIKVYSLWDENYINFKVYVEKELGKRPKGYSLDRIDNDGDYVPGNIRWSDSSIQAINRRNKVGETGFHGVAISGKKFISWIKYRQKRKYLGTYETLKAAVDVRNKYINDNSLPHKIQDTSHLEKL